MSRTTLRLVERHKDLQAEVSIFRCETSVPRVISTGTHKFDTALPIIVRKVLTALGWRPADIVSRKVDVRRMKSYSRILPVLASLNRSRCRFVS